MKVLAALTLAAAVANADERTETIVVTPGPQYEAGGWHRTLLGDDYRDLWTMPIRVEVLDLAKEAGGLTPVRRVGGQQTKGLALKGADGKDYTFRSLDKDPSEILPEDLQDTFVRDIVRDQIAASHPTGSVVAPVLLEAAGVLHQTPRVVALPDDPRLGEFRSLFKGLVGTLEEYPRPGFAGAQEILSGAEMWDRVQKSPADRPDARALLRARLMDLYLGDWDRHRSQWRWARIPGQSKWQPIPEDRDQAFSRYEGLLPSIGRLAAQPRFTRFGPEYPRIFQITFNGWEQDRRYLAELDWPIWEETAKDLQARLADDVIARAVSRMPAEHAARDGRRLTADLVARRSALPQVARQFYEHLASDVDVYGTDRAETFTVKANADGSVDVQVASRADGQTEAYFRRRLLPADTDEVRLYLEGGDDVVEVAGRPRTLVRVIGGAGCDTVRGDTRGVRVSDSDECTKVEGGASLDRHEYERPPGNVRAPWIPPRDWGRAWLPAVFLGGNSDLGVLVGLGAATRSFDFRRHPFGASHQFRVGYATGREAFKAQYEGSYQFENRARRLDVLTFASGVEQLRFYGFGNDSVALGDASFFVVRQQQYLLAPSLTLTLGRSTELSLGPVVSYTTTDLDRTRLIGLLRPYGSEDFGSAGGRATFMVDRRDRPSAPTRGVLLVGEGRVYPSAWDVRSTFGSFRGEASAYFGTDKGLAPTLGLRVGGKQVWGDYPFHEAAYLGGSDTVRGLRKQRFAGDAAAWANAEFRIRLGSLFLILPAEVGLFGLADVGRVFFPESEPLEVFSPDGTISRLEGDPDRWHTGFGGGLWFSFLSRNTTFALALAKSREGTRFYVRSGLGF
jgi:hypothetical protein